MTEIPELIVMRRAKWGARPPKEEAPPLGRLIKHVVATLDTGTAPCWTEEECVRTIREIQRRHMDDLGLDDIQYNFLIGCDGGVYEGRGWKKKSCSSLANPEGFPVGKRRLDIAFIGDWRAEKNPATVMVVPTLALLKHGIDQQYIFHRYRYHDIDYRYVRTKEDEEIENTRYETPRPEYDFSRDFPQDDNFNL